MSAGQTHLDLPTDAIEELLALARNADSLAELVATASRLKPEIGAGPLSSKVADSLGASQSEIRALTYSLLNFYHTQVRLKITSSETAEAVSANIARAIKGDGGKQRGEWDAAKSLIVKAAEQLHPDHPLVMSSKAYRVASSRQYELVDLRIFTDMRPVFNHAGDAINQTVISYVLALDYHDCHEHRVIQFTMDSTDLIALKEACERAEKKAAVIKREFKAMSWPTSVFREPPEQQPDSLETRLEQ